MLEGDLRKEMIYFTADQHFDHYTTATRNIIKYAERPFTSINEMNKTIIRNFNSVVGSEDVTFHLGDFSLKGVGYKHWFETMLKQLNGQHHLILGNHDRLGAWDYVEVGFSSVHTAMMLEEFLLVHDPVVALAVPDRICLCGHVHQMWSVLKERNQRVINVGVDVCDFKPLSIEMVRTIATGSFAL